MKSMRPRAILARAVKLEQDNDALGLLAEVRTCCAEIADLRNRIKRVRAAQLAYGPTVADD